jgi:hypothetical protein
MVEDGLKFLNNRFMKLIGFKEKYDSTLLLSKSAKISEDKPQTLLSDNEIGLISGYLENSEMIFSKTYALYDNEQFIGPYMIFSDGNWIWPSYFSHFLKSDKEIDEEFAHHVREVGYRSDKLSTEKKRIGLTVNPFCVFSIF